ncbi:hypothetical protein ACF061_08945 [Streptomyces sp. NPDC015220]|uniref:hypothetical protein n=1 Tax=Streptomyces sp. NPDC015220 TaxID=3364947 RepID=UPI0036FE229B
MREARCPGPGALPGDETEGGLGPTVAVLVVSLAIAAVGVYQLCGFGLHILNPRPRLFNNGFATAGVIVATMAAGAAVGNLVWLLTAPRRRAAASAAHGPRPAGTTGDRANPAGTTGDHDANPGPAGTTPNHSDNPDSADNTPNHTADPDPATTPDHTGSDHTGSDHPGPAGTGLASAAPAE